MAPSQTYKGISVQNGQFITYIHVSVSVDFSAAVTEDYYAEAWVLV